MYKETFFSNVTDEDIYNFAVGQLKIFGPEVFKLKTSIGEEYYHIDGLKVNSDGKTERVQVDLDYFTPVELEEDKETRTKLKIRCINSVSLNENLEAYKEYIRLMSERNMGRASERGSYDELARGLYNRIINKIKSSEHERQA